MRRAWKELKTQAQDPSELAKWEAEYQQVLQAQREEGETNIGDMDYDYGTEMRNAWEQRQGRTLNSDFGEQAQSNQWQLNATGEPVLSDYPFGTSAVYSRVAI